MRIPHFLRRVHKWLGILIGIQILLWVSGGVVMSFFPIERVRGEHLSRKTRPYIIDPAVPRLSLADVMERAQGRPIESISLRGLLGRPVYDLRTQEATILFDARTGERLTPLPRELATAIAEADYGGPGKVASVRWIEDPLDEIRGRPLPLWQVRFDDASNTTLYIAPDTAQIRGRRTDLWRFYDFFWMLHIMDYEKRSNFNNGLLIWTAVGAFVFTISGWALLFMGLRRKGGQR